MEMPNGWHRVWDNVEGPYQKEIWDALTYLEEMAEALEAAEECSMIEGGLYSPKVECILKKFKEWK